MAGTTVGDLGLGSEQSALVGKIPADCRELDWMALKALFQHKPFCDSLYGREKQVPVPINVMGSSCSRGEIPSAPEMCSSRPLLQLDA